LLQSHNGNEYTKKVQKCTKMLNAAFFLELTYLFL
jgi:hypothetical protein